MNNELINKEYTNGLTRNYYEICNARNSILAYNDLVSMFNKISVYPNEFLGQCYFALFYSSIAHTINVLDIDGRSFTFQNILKNNKKKVLELLEQNQLKINFVKDMQKKLRKLRTKQLFHIDKEYLDDSNKIWNEIDINGADLNKLIIGLYNTIKSLYLEEVNPLLKYAEYNENSILDFIAKDYHK